MTFNIKEQSMRLPARKHYWVAQLIKSKIERNATFEKKKALKKNITKEVIATSPVKLISISSRAGGRTS